MVFFENDQWLHNDVISAHKDALTVPIDHTDTSATVHFDINLQPSR